jgi:hypothetical protein
MESPPVSVLTWPTAIIAGIAATFSAIATYLTVHISKKKLPSEIHKTDAEAGLAEAQRDDLQLKTNMTAGEMLREMNRYTILVERKLEQRDVTIRLLEQQVEVARERGNLKRLTGD